MNQQLIAQLSVITEEEQAILSGRSEIDATLYSAQHSPMVIDSGKMLEHGKLIRIRPAFRMMGEEENNLRDFLISCLRQENRFGNYLHFQVADVLPVQNLIENMVWTLLNNQPDKRSINQITMGLLFLQLTHCTERIQSASQSPTQQLILQVLRYIDENYREGELTELAAILGYDVPWLSRAIKRLLGRTYKELLQIKRLNQAAFLLQNTRLPITDICAAVGYDNTSYFHRIFREYYHQTPGDYRRSPAS